MNIVADGNIHGSITGADDLVVESIYKLRGSCVRAATFFIAVDSYP
jgi:hypothetical protein